MPWGITEHINHLQKLLVPGAIGNYNSFEVTEIFGLHEDRPGQITNFMSLLVAEPSDPPVGPPTKPDILNGKKRIELRETLWKFGIARYRVSTHQVLQALQNLSITGEWKPGISALKVGALTPIPPQFVPADTAPPHPWNGVLKNNFWEGSHVLELFDGLKKDVKFLLDEPKLLKQLAANLWPFVKMGIDGLSDRLGNVLIQLPVTVVTTKVSSSQNGDFLVQPIWHNATPARQLRVSCEKYEDTTVEGYGFGDVTGSLANFPLHSPGGGARYVLWDDQNQLVLGASAQTSFITSISMNVHAVGESNSTREFYIPLPNGTLEPVAVPLIEERKPNVIGKPTANPREPWRENRFFRDSLKSIRERKEFIQYGGNSGAGLGDALRDIRTLLRMHGRTGAWLWDPYLDAKDVLATLFHCPHKGADLCAITAGAEPPVAKDKEKLSEAVAFCQRVETWLRRHPLAGWVGLKPQSAQPPKQSWQDKQLETFKNSKGNCKDLQLEFRIREGNAGWPFHDRFLIFPSDFGLATAWSLGTSVNSFGQKHHILQKVADGELIRQAFLDLWDELSGSDYLVWRAL
ncbi:MAG: hypothetical protein FT714_08485 [Pantoea sp. Pent]|nr:hypothetical protein [Pantoea sp. Pent]